MIYAERTETVSFGANCAARLTALQEPLDRIREEVFFLDLRLLNADGDILSYNRYVFSRSANLAPLLTCRPAMLSISSSTGESAHILTLTNTGETAAMFVWLEDARDLNALGYVYFDDNYFCLLPAESRTMTVAWKDVAAEERRLEVSGWNTEHILLDLSIHRGT
jgi:beta-mannosidase